MLTVRFSSTGLNKISLKNSSRQYKVMDLYVATVYYENSVVEVENFISSTFDTEIANIEKP